MLQFCLQDFILEHDLVALHQLKDNQPVQSAFAVVRFLRLVLEELEEVVDLLVRVLVMSHHLVVQLLQFELLHPFLDALLDQHILAQLVYLGHVLLLLVDQLPLVLDHFGVEVRQQHILELDHLVRHQREQ